MPILQFVKSDIKIYNSNIKFIFYYIRKFYLNHLKLIKK